MYKEYRSQDKTEGATDFCSFPSSVNRARGQIHDINHPGLHPGLHRQNYIWNPQLLLYFDAKVRLHTALRENTFNSPFTSKVVQPQDGILSPFKKHKCPDCMSVPKHLTPH